MLPVILLLITTQRTTSWGPFTHQYFASKDKTHAISVDFRAGASGPDSVKKIESSLHSFLFASSLYETAISNGGAAGIDFALGWGCHLTHDAVGHHANGFLNPKADHPLEFAVDTYVTFSPTPAGHFSQISSAMAELLANASEQAAHDNPSIKAVTLSQVNSGIASFKTLTTAESIALRLNKWTYKGQLVKDSFCNVTNIDDVMINFATATNWTTMACSAWENTMQKSGGKNGTSAEEQITDYINKLFVENGGSSCRN